MVRLFKFKVTIVIKSYLNLICALMKVYGKKKKKEKSYLLNYHDVEIDNTSMQIKLDSF